MERLKSSDRTKGLHLPDQLRDDLAQWRGAIKVTIRDPAILSTIKPSEVVRYLQATGWKKESEQTGKWSIWLHEREGEEYEVTVPLKTQYRDFAFRISDILCVLEVFEKRSQLEIFQDLLPASPR
jgi:hypothetical protein